MSEKKAVRHNSKGDQHNEKGGAQPKCLIKVYMGEIFPVCLRSRFFQFQSMLLLFIDALSQPLHHVGVNLVVLPQRLRMRQGT